MVLATLAATALRESHHTTTARTSIQPVNMAAPHGSSIDNALTSGKASSSRAPSGSSINNSLTSGEASSSRTPSTQPSTTPILAPQPPPTTHPAKGLQVTPRQPPPPSYIRTLRELDHFDEIEDRKSRYNRYIQIWAVVSCALLIGMICTVAVLYGQGRLTNPPFREERVKVDDGGSGA